VLSEKQIKALNTITPTDGFGYFSGYRGTKSHLLPAIYQYNGGKFCVVGPGHELQYDSLKGAVRAYKMFFKHLLKTEKRKKKNLLKRLYKRFRDFMLFPC